MSEKINMQVILVNQHTVFVLALPLSCCPQTITMDKARQTNTRNSGRRGKKFASLRNLHRCPFLSFFFSLSFVSFFFSWEVGLFHICVRGILKKILNFALWLHFTCKGLGFF